MVLLGLHKHALHAEYVDASMAVQDLDLTSLVAEPPGWPTVTKTAYFTLITRRSQVRILSPLPHLT